MSIKQIVPSACPDGSVLTDLCIEFEKGDCKSEGLDLFIPKSTEREERLKWDKNRYFAVNFLELLHVYLVSKSLQWDRLRVLNFFALGHSFRVGGS